MSYGPASGASPGFRENRLLQAWSAGQATLNGWLVIPDSCSAEAMAHAGWDSLTLDMQHGLIDYAQAVQMLMAISTTGTVPLVRVPWLDEGQIMKMLDAGAYGIICPMINTQQQARRFAGACLYAPRGCRSFGPIRASLYAGDAYKDRANDILATFAMIETREALGNLEKILAVEELTGVYIGPVDLSLSLGARPMLDQEDPVVVQAIEHIVRTAKASGKRVGMHNGTVAYALRMVSLGADFVSVGSDMHLMMAGARDTVSQFRTSCPVERGPEAGLA
jgi:4-hydroxy-2-oxoheptanedioate aldolase